jgi:hypothetical protein
MERPCSRSPSSFPLHSPSVYSPPVVSLSVPTDTGNSYCTCFETWPCSAEYALDLVESSKDCGGVRVVTVASPNAAATTIPLLLEIVSPAAKGYV